MAKQQFKAESKKLLDLMINSIYTNKEIFLRELISNASDALDKLYYNSLTDKSIKVNKKKLAVKIDIDKENRTLTISDNGIGMNKEELKENLGTIAKSGTQLFKENLDKNDKLNIIGQFGVGFYSSFMVSDKVEVISKKYNEEEAYKWVSNGADGFEITTGEKEEIGTTIILHIKENNEDEEYNEYLEDYKIKELIKKYSNYITYPIMMLEDKKYEEVNSMIPLWKKDKKKIKDEEYNNFYHDKFLDYNDPLKVIHVNVEGLVNYDAVLFIPSNKPFDYYTKNYEKGLELYSNDVLIMEKCSDLLPDYLNFVKGVVSSPDLSLNISREILQQNKVLQTISKTIEKKILKELENMLKEDKEKYNEFFKNFGEAIKYGIYENFGLKKDELKDLIIFYSADKKENITLKEYVSNMKKEDDTIYYACGESIDKIDLMPQVEMLKDKNKDILYLTDYIDEFVLKVIENYDNKKFVNVATNDFDLSTEDEKEKLKEKNESSKDLFDFMKKELPSEIISVKYTNKLKNHPVCLSSEGDVTTQMQKVINAMPTDETVKANLVLEINENHPISKKIEELYENDKEMLKKYVNILYNEARLIEGLGVDNPAELSKQICDILSK